MSETDSPDDRQDLATRVNVATTGVFLIWMAATLVGGFSVGIALIGIAAVIAAGQLVCVAVGIGLDGAWLFAALSFVAAGLWHTYPPDISLTPVLLFAVGALLIAAAFIRRRPPE